MSTRTTTDDFDIGSTGLGIDGSGNQEARDLISRRAIEERRPVYRIDPTEALKYGHRVRIVGMPCSEKWRTDEGSDRVDFQSLEYGPIESKHNDN